MEGKVAGGTAKELADVAADLADVNVQVEELLLACSCFEDDAVSGGGRDENLGCLFASPAFIWRMPSMQ